MFFTFSFTSFCLGVLSAFVYPVALEDGTGARDKSVFDLKGELNHDP